MGATVEQSASGLGELGVSSPAGKIDPTKVGHTDYRCPRPPQVKHTISAGRKEKEPEVAGRGTVAAGRATGLAGLTAVVVGLAVGVLVADWSFGGGGNPLFQPPGRRVTEVIGTGSTADRSTILGGNCGGSAATWGDAVEGPVGNSCWFARG